MGEICNCGTCSDANKVAVKLVTEMLDNNCALWAVQVGLAMSTITGYLVAGMCQQNSMTSDITKEMYLDLQRQMTPSFHADLDKFTDLRDRVIKLTEYMPSELRELLKAVVKDGI